MDEIAQLRGPILRSVSRSFYLSIRLLPKVLRDPIAVAYLLARATDTMADTAEIDRVERMRELARLAGLIQGENLPDTFPNFAAQQTDADERRLIELIPQLLRWLRALPADEQKEIRDVLLRINEGQTLDLERFGDSSRVVALATAAELDRYTYLVAGCVGEFWTRICFLQLPHFSRKTPDEMVSLGVEYGKGLQLINILRDLGRDLAAGRCYLPAEEIRALGCEPSKLRAHASELAPLLERWQARAEEGMAAGVEYSCAITSWRPRLAAVLPALIGTRTIARLRAAGPEVLDRKIKIPRGEVRAILLKMFATGAAPWAIRATFGH